MIIAIIGVLGIATISASAVRTAVNSSKTVDENVAFVEGLGVADSMRLAVEFRDATRTTGFDLTKGRIERVNEPDGKRGFAGVVRDYGYRFYTDNPDTAAVRTEKGWTLKD